MLPTERREVSKQRIRHALSASTQDIECAAEINGVPQRDRGGDQCKAAGAMLLGLGGSVSQATETMEADGAGERIAGLALVEFGGCLASERRLLGNEG